MFLHGRHAFGPSCTEFCGRVGGTFLKLSYSLGLFVGSLLHALKLRLGGGGGGLHHYSVSPMPLGFGFGT